LLTAFFTAFTKFGDGFDGSNKGNVSCSYSAEKYNKARAMRGLFV